MKNKEKEIKNQASKSLVEKLKQILSDRKKILTYIAVFIVVSLVFFLFSTFRQKYVGGYDPYGYYSQSKLLKSGQFSLKTRIDPKIYPSIAPFGYYARNGKVIPHFPPGYPLIMTLFGIFGLEFYVTPVIGALSFILIFLILTQFVNRFIAITFSFLWVLSPIVVWGSTFVMSDLVACFFILLAYYFFIRGKTISSASIFGFSLLIRPSNILCLLALLPQLVKQKKLIKFAFYFGIVSILPAVYNLFIHGAPWKYGQYNTGALFSSSKFPTHLVFYSKEIFFQITPLIIFLAFIALYKRKGKVLIYVIWFLSFLFFYSFIKLSNQVWWGIRFLLPAIPALFIMSAIGLQELQDLVSLRYKKINVYFRPAIFFLTIFILSYFIHFESKKLLFYKNKNREFYIVAQKVAEKVPPQSIIGATNLSGALRLYTNLESFVYTRPKSNKLIIRMIKKNVPIYLIVEPWDFNKEWSLRKLKRFKYKKVLKVDTPSGPFSLMKLYR